MMALFFGQLANPVHERKRLLEVRKLEHSMDVVIVDHIPVWKLMAEGVKGFALERGNVTTAGHTGFRGKGRHVFSRSVQA